VRRGELTGLCAELGFDGVAGRVHRWAVDG
jgi:hypothetical protein